MARQVSLLIERRAFLSTLGVTLAGGALAWRTLSATAPAEVSIVEFSDAGVRGKTVKVAKVVKTDAEWRAQLSDLSYQVTRHEDTERPFSGPTWNNHQAGLYRCVCCDTALFASDTKFESGTGWPSFWAPLAKENVVEKHDLSLGMERTAVSCARCDAHLGHVFDDGPRPTGLRYCMNSVAMRFVKRA
jgi:peptide-methionine (R)-S-oxide reductase